MFAAGVAASIISPGVLMPVKKIITGPPLVLMPVPDENYNLELDHITFPAGPSIGDTITLDGRIYTFSCQGTVVNIFRLAS